MRNKLFDEYVKEHLAGYRPDVPAHLWGNILFDDQVKEQLGNYQPDVPAHLLSNVLLDNKFKGQFENYQPEVPSYIWKNIAAQTGRKKPVGFWSSLQGAQKIAAILILSALSAIGIYFLSGNNNSGKNTEAVASEKTNSPEINKDNTIEENRADQGSSLKDDVNKNHNQNNKPEDNSSEKNILSANEQNVAKASAISNSKSAARSNKFTNRSKTRSAISKAFEQDEVENINSAEESSLLTATNIDLALIRSNTKLSHRLIMPVLPQSKSIPCPQAERDAAGNKRYLEVYAGPDYVFRTFTDSPNSLYSEQRKASSKYLFAYSAGIRYTKVFGSGMSLRTGINYSMVNERFKSVKGHVIQNVYITNSHGDTTGTYTETGTQYKENTNKYKSIDIPLIMGYEWGNGRVHANIYAGPMVNIFSKRTGYVLAANGDAVDISSGKGSSVYQYKTNAGVSLTGGVSVYYKLNEKFHLLAEPYFKYSLSPATRPELSLKEKFHTVGLRLGMRREF